MLDERTEAILLEAMSTLSGGETVAVTRHPESTIMSADGLTILATGHARPTRIGDRDAGDLTPDDATLAVLVMDGYLTIASHIQEMPGAVAINDATRQQIKAVREKLRGMI